MKILSFKGPILTKFSKITLGWTLMLPSFQDLSIPKRTTQKKTENFKTKNTLKTWILRNLSKVPSILLYGGAKQVITLIKKWQDTENCVTVSTPNLQELHEKQASQTSDNFQFCSSQIIQFLVSIFSVNFVMIMKKKKRKLFI
jgi:hypothetical protein